MTAKDYSIIQRNIGYIEGLISSCDILVCEGIMGALEAIETIINADNKRITDTDTVHLKLDKEWAEDFIGVAHKFDKNCFKHISDDELELLSELAEVIRSKLEDL